MTGATPTPESMIDYDTDVEYTCDPGYTHSSGDLISVRLVVRSGYNLVVRAL